MRLYQRLKRQILSQVKLVRIGLGVAAVAAFIVAWWLIIGPLASQGLHLWRAVYTGLPSADGRTNFLILGREGTDTIRGGGLLTDTLILVSINPQAHDTVLLSIPRDIWVPSLKAKINSAYYYGEQKKPGMGGLILAKAAVGEVIGQPIHYAVVIDFAGFEKIIDLIGGVDIQVDRGFVDHKFPIAGKENDLCGGDPLYACRYETIEFKAGLQHLDGVSALKFVRSRQAEGEEGSDFARSRRQEKTLLALRSKLLSKPVLTNLSLLKQLFDQTNRMVVTDVTPDLYPALARLAWQVYKTPPRTATLAEPDQLIHPPVSTIYGSQWVLLAKDSLPADVKNLLAIPGQQ